MIEWIIFIVLALIISEFLFLKWGDESEWVLHKFCALILGSGISALLFLLPYLCAYKCEVLNTGEAEATCINYGAQVFYWLYGVIIGVALLFWINHWLIKRKGKKKREVEEDLE